MNPFRDAENIGVVNDILEAGEQLANARGPFLHRNDPFELSDTKFQRIYRLDKNMVDDIVNCVEAWTGPQSRASALDAEVKTLAALRFFASGSYQLDIGLNHYAAFSQPSVSRCLHDVCDALLQPEIFDSWVYFPSTLNELQLIQQQFWEKFGFPGVIGCIDCTHIAIVPPPADDPIYPEQIYINRKGYSSINTQLICDANLRILNVNARYSGATHDSFIWKNSNVLPFLQELHGRGHEDFYLIGDSGYALRPWLRTPILPHPAGDSPEGLYNRRFIQTRSTIERCNGVLKARFRCCLKDRTLHYRPTMASNIIKCCVMLHNMCIERNIPIVAYDQEYEMVDGLFHNGDANDEGNIGIQENERRRARMELQRARELQNIVIENFFTPNDA